MANSLVCAPAARRQKTSIVINYNTFHIQLWVNDALEWPSIQFGIITPSHQHPRLDLWTCGLLQTRQTARRLQSCISSFQDQLRILYSANLPRTVHATLSHAPVPSATAIGPPLIHQHPVDAILRTLKLASQ